MAQGLDGAEAQGLHPAWKQRLKTCLGLQGATQGEASRLQRAFLTFYLSVGSGRAVQLLPLLGHTWGRAETSVRWRASCPCGGFTQAFPAGLSLRIPASAALASEPTFPHFYDLLVRPLV